jgi:hypothetical protein
MTMSNRVFEVAVPLLVLWTAGLASCANAPTACNGVQDRNLESAFEQAQTSLSNGCAADFERYFDDLLKAAEGDPKPGNKRLFSEFLVWASDQGILSRQQARDYYNRYFNVKFMSLAGDYNNCSHTCPRRDGVMVDMERELADKERGLMKVSLDNQSYYRADELYREVELVLEATCTACAESGGL